ncbi:FkbM family methyltransferase [Fontisphaera persica]|uniref:FkbM family methyltransferase n=1 Tax=Fontisphaera persica TaxID=2974023 RepID=UPI0024C00173|nr:FkbM family methyltransferase [Fontisphaera persica]WCJ58129.1 FkbM family methyltransferase [Fontisphaera persica]
MKRLLPPALRRAMRAGLQRLGYDLVNQREWGRDSLMDVANLFGPSPPKVIFDVGANVGQFLGRVLQHFPSAHCHAFEPFPQAFATLQQFAAPYPNVTAHCLALGDEDGNKELHVNEANVTNSLLATDAAASHYSPPGWQETRGVLPVPVRRLETFCREHKVDRIDLLKVDAQGYDLRILQGAGALLEQHRIRCLLLEVLFVPLYEGQAYFHEIYDFLWQRHYHLVGLYEINRAPDGSAKWADALFVSHRPPSSP